MYLPLRGVMDMETSLLTCIASAAGGAVPFAVVGAVAWGRVREQVDRVVMALEKLGDKLDDHGHRLTRLETLVEKRNSDAPRKG